MKAGPVRAFRQSARVCSFTPSALASSSGDQSVSLSVGMVSISRPLLAHISVFTDSEVKKLIGRSELRQVLLVEPGRLDAQYCCDFPQFISSNRGVVIFECR
nr:MAG TPA: hypothetical protein [Caudoviricetes sp.]